MKIIDGYNLIGAAGALGLALSQPDKEERLLRLLTAWRSRRRSAERLLVVFDGTWGGLARGPRRSRRGEIEVEWSAGESADQLILRRVRQAARPREVEVVTSDAEILRQAATWGARGTRSQEFLARLREATAVVAGAEKPEGSDPGEIEEWLERFGGG